MLCVHAYMCLGCFSLSLKSKLDSNVFGTISSLHILFQYAFDDNNPCCVHISTVNTPRLKKIRESFLVMKKLKHCISLIVEENHDLWSSLTRVRFLFIFGLSLHAPHASCNGYCDWVLYVVFCIVHKESTRLNLLGSTN